LKKNQFNDLNSPTESGKVLSLNKKDTARWYASDSLLGDDRHSVRILRWT